jgi:hypothetical protein
MPGAMACRVPKGLSVSIQPQSKGMRPKADVGPPGRAPQPQLRAHLAPGASLPGLAARLGRMLSRGQVAEAVAPMLAENPVATRPVSI